MKFEGGLRVIGLIATIIGAGATLVNNWVKDKEIDDRIDQKIEEALAKENEEDEEES